MKIRNKIDLFSLLLPTMARVLVSCGRAPASIHLAKLFSIAGHEVIIADSNRFHFGRYRKWAYKILKHPSPRHNPDEFVSWLNEVVKTEKIDLIVPVYEETFHFSYHKDSIPCKIFTSDIDVLDKLHDKFRFIEFCKSIGLDVPETVKITDVNELENPPLNDFIAKPVYSRFGHNVQINPTIKNFRGKISKDRPWILQERVHGVQYCLQGICFEGKVLSVSCYGSEFTVSKSSVLFKNNGRGDIGGIIAKIAKGLNYTGFICFDVFESDDGRILPIECNPRATSALHLYSENDNLAGCVMENQQIEATGIARRITAPMYMNLSRNLFKKGHFKKWRRAMRESKSTELDRFSIRISLLKYLVLLNFITVALRNRISIISATSFEYEWNDDEKKRVNL